MKVFYYHVYFDSLSFNYDKFIMPLIFLILEFIEDLIKYQIKLIRYLFNIKIQSNPQISLFI